MKSKEIIRDWHLIDAKGKVLGRLSTLAADFLRGKGKVNFAPNADLGDYVVVVNAKGIKLTGNKLNEKKYYSHTGYLGNLKTKTLSELMKVSPEEVIKMSVSGMLPKNKLSALFMNRLKVYPEDVHPHQNIKFKTEN